MKLIETLHKCNCMLSEKENWSYRYRIDKRSFKMLIEAESKLEIQMNKYFRDLSKRVDQYIDWNKYRDESIKAVDFIIDIGFDPFEDEEMIIKSFIQNGLTDAVVAGAMAQEKITKIDMGINSTTDWVLKSVRERGSKLVKDLNKTTRNKINRSIETSINLGEDNQNAIKRLNKVINDPKRAELISKTESVRAYNDGTVQFGKETGAKKKQWHTSDPCPICQPLNGEVVDFDQLFPGGYNAPPVHPRCKCGISLIY